MVQLVQKELFFSAFLLSTAGLLLFLGYNIAASEKKHDSGLLYNFLPSLKITVFNEIHFVCEMSDAPHTKLVRALTLTALNVFVKKMENKGFFH